MIPETIKNSATAGERMFFKTLRDVLPDDFIVYYEPEIRNKYPDFVIIGPDLGILVLEVKDYKRNKLLSANSDNWVLWTDTGEESVISPLKQSRQYMFHIIDCLKKDKDLVQLEGPYKMKLKFPCGYGTVFTRLTQRHFIENDLYDIIAPNLCFTREEIDYEDANFSKELFMEKIYSMFTIPFKLNEKLTYDEMNRIRFHLFPEIRISAEKGERTPYQDQLLLSLHDIKVMDLHQEKLARQLGDRNRLIRGVAGSGKTLILASRAKILAKQHPDWNILILCFNISLAKTIEQLAEQMMNEPEDLFDFLEEKREHNVKVRYFHEFLFKDLRTKEHYIPTLIQKIDDGSAIMPKYDAILIDEGQDFDSNWYMLVSKLLNPATMSLLLVEDRAQDIYRRKRSYVQDTGLDFRGRSKILNINYRNTAEIVHFAWDFYKHFTKLGDHLLQTQLSDEIIIPRSTKRSGQPPAIKSFTSFFEEADFVARQIERLWKIRGIPLEEILILYRVKYASGFNYIGVLQRALQERNIPNYWITENEESKRKFNRHEPSVKICTFDSSKGLDFAAVFMVGLQETPFQKEEELEKEISRVYIGMTRAKQYLCLTYSGKSIFTNYFEMLQQNKVQDGHMKDVQ